MPGATERKRYMRGEGKTSRGDYDMKKKVEIDWETKEPTGRVFTDYNNGNWKGDER